MYESYCLQAGPASASPFFPSMRGSGDTMMRQRRRAGSLPIGQEAEVQSGKPVLTVTAGAQQGGAGRKSCPVLLPSRSGSVCSPAFIRDFSSYLHTFSLYLRPPFPTCQAHSICEVGPVITSG